MSLRPVKRSRRRQNRYPRFETSGSWNFSWKPVKTFDPVKHRRALLVLFILSVLGFSIAWAADPNNPLFHSQTVYHQNISKLGPPPPGDPQLVYVLWHATAPQSSLGEYLTTSGAGYTGSCLGTSCMDLHPSASLTQVAISKSPVADLSVANSKQLLIDQTFAFSNDAPILDASAQNTCSTCSTITATLAINHANELVVVHFIYQSGSLTDASFNIHDSLGAVWTERQFANGSPTKMVYWFANGFAAAPSDTFNVTSTGGNASAMQLSVYDIACSSLGDCSLSFDPNGGTICSATSTSPSCGFGPTLSNQQMAIGLLSSGCGCTPTTGAGFTAINRFSTGGGDEYQVYTGSTTSSVTWTITSSAWVLAEDVIDAQRGCCPASPSSTFGWFLTTNSTLPTHAIGSTASYNPRNDPSVVLLNQIYTIGANSFESDLHILRTPISNGTTIAQEDIGCITNSSSSGSCFLPVAGSSMTAGSQFTSDLILNFTGGTAGGAACNWGAGVAVGQGCSFLNIKNAANNAEHSQTLPWFTNLSGKLYMGYYSLSGNSFVVRWAFDTGNNVGGDAIGYGWNCTAGVPPCGNLDTGGFFGPLIKALTDIGIFIFNALLGFISFVTPALQGALNFLEGVMVTALNGLGNVLGLGNIGTDLQNLIGSLVTFFGSGNFGSIFTNLPTLFARMIDALAVYFPWLPIALSTALNLLTLGINSIGFLLTITKFAFSYIVGGFVIYLIAFWFIYTGDNALGGVLEYFETTEYLVVGLGIKFIGTLTNFVLDVATAIIGVIPKPFIQMVAHKLPRIPIVEVNARFVWPSGAMGEISNGNLLSVALWMAGLLFTDLYESASPALPGSIGALLPSTANSLKSLTGLVPLLEILTAFVWGTAFLIVPIQYFGNALDFGDLPVSSSLGAKTSRGFGGITVHKASKRFQGRLEHKIAMHGFGKVQSEKRQRELGIMKEAQPMENIN